MNITNVTEPNSTDATPRQLCSCVKDPYIEPHGLRVFRLTLFSLIILASLIGNSLVCKAIFQIPIKPKPFSYYLVASLAVAEIISSICQPFIMTASEKYGHWVFGGFACVLVNPLQVLAMCVATISLAAIAVYRYRVMVTPKKTRPTGKVMIFTIAGLWLMAVAISMPLFVTRTIVHFPRRKICMSVFPGEDGKKNYRTYSLVRFFLSFGAPFLILMVSYGAVALRLKHHVKRNSSELSASVSVSLTTAEGGENCEMINRQHEAQEMPEVPEKQQQPEAASNASESHKKRKSCAELESDLLRMIYVIIISFVVCYIPYQTYFLWEYFDGCLCWRFRYQILTRKYFYILTCLPSAIHPLCYGTMNTFFARAFSRIILCKR